MYARFSYLFLALLFFSCGKKSVFFSSEKLINSGYNAYKTYAFLPTSDVVQNALENRKVLIPLMVVEAKKELDKKGMSLDTLAPDCLFTYHMSLHRNYAVNQDKEVVYDVSYLAPGQVPVSNYSVGISGASYQRAGTAAGSGYYYFSSDNRPYTYNGKIHIDTLREGSFIVDMIDAKTRKVIWRSSVEGKKSESEKMTPEDAAKYYVRKLLSKLPRK